MWEESKEAKYTRIYPWYIFWRTHVRCTYRPWWWAETVMMKAEHRTATWLSNSTSPAPCDLGSPVFCHAISITGCFRHCKSDICGFLWSVYERGDRLSAIVINFPFVTDGYSIIWKTRKPYCRKETARCSSCSLLLKLRRHSLQV